MNSALPVWADIALTLLLALGAAFALLGSWALARLGSFLARVHGPSKATTAGVGCVLIASALWFGLQGSWSADELLVALFLFMTAPVSAHLLVKAALHLDPSLRPGPAKAMAQPPSAIRVAETESARPPR
jgi:multicomponent K+:H+ antiporter subunit G